MGVQLTGFSELMGKLGALAGYFSTDAQAVSHDELLKIGNNIAEAAKLYAPVRTGELLKGIQVIDMEEANEVWIWSKAPYSLFVEFGTVHMAAQPFMRPAYEEFGVKLALANRHKQEIGEILGVKI